MPFRKIDTVIWDDPWFERLSLKGKLLFIYLFSNRSCTPSGMYRITAKRVEFECGVEIDKLCDELREKVYWDSANSVVWVKNFFRHQCQNPKFAAAALSSIRDFPLELQAMFLKRYHILFEKYGMNTISVPSTNGTDTRTQEEGSGEVFSIQIQNSDSEKATGEESRARAHAIAPSVPKNEIPYEEIIQDLNLKTEKNYRPTKQNKDLIKARWQEGFGLQDFHAVHEKMAIKWKNDPKMNQYLRPSTLYAVSKFEGYLNTKITLADTGKASAMTVKNLEIIKNFNPEA